MNQLMKTSNKQYTYDEFLHQKQLLKDEVKDMENMFSKKNIPQTLSLFSAGITQQSLGLMKNSNISGIAIDWIIRIGSKKLITKLVGKKGPYANILLMLSAYYMPSILSKGKKLLISKLHKKKQKTLNENNF